MNKKIIVLAAVLVAFLAGRYFSPKQVETKEVEKIVYKEKERSNEDRHTHVEIQEITLPDGTKVVQTVSDERTHAEREASKETETSREVSSKSNSLQPQWSIGIYTDKETVDGSVDRRILGGLFIGIHGHSELHDLKPRVGLGLRLEL